MSLQLILGKNLDIKVQKMCVLEKIFISHMCDWVCKKNYVIRTYQNSEKYAQYNFPTLSNFLLI